MADQIVITEKTSQAKDIRTAVGSRYGDILPAEGHLFDLLGRPKGVSMLSSRDREQRGGRVAGQWRFTHVRDLRYCMLADIQSG